jgi:hypothetical protein
LGISKYGSDRTVDFSAEASDWQVFEKFQAKKQKAHARFLPAVGFKTE